MNKQEYMYNLFEALRPFDEEIRDEIISDYEEHFSMGIASGKTEEQIVEELGSIEELIAELNTLKNGGKSKNKSKEIDININTKDIAKAVDGFAKGLANFIGSIAGTVTKGAEKFGENVSDGAESFANGFSEAADKVKSKGSEYAKDVSEGFKNARGTKEDDGVDAEDLGCSEFSFDDCEKVVVETDCGNINVFKSENNEFRINYENFGSANQQLAYKFECYKKGDTLYAKAKKQNSVSNFFKSMVSPRIEINVWIPDELEKLDLSSASGAIIVNGQEAEKLEISDVSGMVSIESCKIEKGDISNVSGSVNAKGLEAEKLDVSTVSGAIKLETDAESVELSTTSGAVSLTGTDYEDIDVSTVSGSVTINIIGGDGFEADASSVSGRINLRCKDSVINGTKSGRYTLGNGETKINAGTVSGSIIIEME